MANLRSLSPEMRAGLPPQAQAYLAALEAHVVELRQETYTSTALLQVAEAVGHTRDLQATLDLICRLAPILAGVDRCTIFLRKSEKEPFYAAHTHTARSDLPVLIRECCLTPDVLPLLGEALRRREPVQADDTASHPLVPDSWRQTYGSKSILIVPLTVQGQSLGALVADDVDDAYHFTYRRVRILAGIAGQLSLALENEHLLRQERERLRQEQELNLAHQIQYSLIPRQHPPVPGYQVHSYWRSARELAGDFFDCITLPRRRVGFAVADVSDKGVPAAIFMALVRTLLRNNAQALSPAQALRRTNEHILTDISADSDMFVTMWHGVLDWRTHRLIYADAGHGLAFLARANDGSLTRLRGPGMPLGILSTGPWADRQVTLEPGDAVVLYTDGTPDALNGQSKEFGDERLQAVIREHASESAEAISQAIESAVQAHVGEADLYDDLTLIVLKRAT
ncbi:MAG: SpoIIE family protein phosphatase [Anaerolineae bacterium]|nr:SpoIIE family protein phosphatase [Anaerolineae bacterium]